MRIRPPESSGLPLGNGTTEYHNWNDRFQPTSMSAGTPSGLQLGLKWYPCPYPQTSCSTGNNGNILEEDIVTSGTINIDGTPNGTPTASRGYAYDGLGRLTLAEEKTSTGFTPTCPDASGVWCQGFQYDVAGNRSIATRRSWFPLGCV